MSGEGTPARKSPRRNSTPTVPDDQEPNADCLLSMESLSEPHSGNGTEARTKVSALLGPHKGTKGAREGRRYKGQKTVPVPPHVCILKAWHKPWSSVMSACARAVIGMHD